MFEAIKKYAVFSGRARRKEWWLFLLLGIIVTVVGTIIDVTMGTIMYEDEERAVGLFSAIGSLGLLIPFLAVSVRRLHDENTRGWWFLFWFTGIGGIVLLIFFCLRGTVGENRFGDDPLANE